MKKKIKGRKYPGRNRHHLVPKSRGGSNHPSNLLLIDIEKHREWHRIFGNKTLSEVIDLLIRLEKAKKGQT